MKLLFNTIQTRPNSVSSQSVKSEEEEKKHHEKHANSTQRGTVLTAPRSVHSTGHRSKVSAHAAAEASGGTPATPAASTTTTETHFTDELDYISAFGDHTVYLGLTGAKLQAQALLKIVEIADSAKVEDLRAAIKEGFKIFRPENDKGEKIQLTEVDTLDFNGLKQFAESNFKGHEYNSSGDNLPQAADLKNSILVYDKELTKYKPGHDKYYKAVNEKSISKTELEKIGGKKGGFGSGFWGTTAIAAVMAGLGAIGAKMLGDSSVKAAEEKAKAADDKVTALQEQIQSILQQLGQVMQAMQAKGDKSTAQLTNLVARLLKLQQKAGGAASTPAHGSIASAKVASRTVRSDDNSAGSAPNLDELEKQVTALEKNQQTQGSKPTSPQESSHDSGGAGMPSNPSGGDKQSGGGGFKMPQLPDMPQGGGNQNAGAPPVQQQPQPPQQYEQPRVRIHRRAPEDSSNGMVPIVLGDTRRKFSNTGNNVLYEEADGDD